VLFAVLEANGALRSLMDDRVGILAGRKVTLLGAVEFGDYGPFDINIWLWALIGAAALALVMFLLSAPRQQVARMPLAVLGFGAFGVLLALAIDESRRPALDDAWGKVVICCAVGVVLFGLLGLRKGRAIAQRGALTGFGLGWLIGAWGGADIGNGNLAGALLATVVPAVAIGARIGLAADATPQRRRRIDQRSRAWIFLVPALSFIAAGLVIPLLKTIYQSFRNRDNTEAVGFENYRTIFSEKNSFNLDNWTSFFTSRLFWIGAGIVGAGIVIGVLAGRRTRQRYDRSESSMIPIFVGLFLVACAILSTVRGTIFNNLWWVVVVTTLATALGLGVAVLADRAKGENVAKSLIFLPMAISFVGAAIIWRFMYIGRPASNDQTGVLNSLWVWLGTVSTSDVGKWVAVALLAAIAVALALLVRWSLQRRRASTAGFAAGFLLLVAYFIYRFIGPGLGGFVETEGGTQPKTIEFLNENPFNNLWLMVILIWIQTGFAMVILSSAIKAVPTEFVEAAKVDGATESQVFWRITMPQIAPTIGVVVTTLIVTVMKVFDIVKVTTNGNFDTQVIANQMFTEAFGNSNEGLGGALAVVLFVSVMPVMYINIRRMQKARV